MTAPSAPAPGQAAEWLLWSHLTLHSPLHVFLPLWDMGADAVVRIPGTDVAAAVQVKGRHALDDGKLHVLVRDHELRDPHTIIVVVVLDVPGVALHDPVIAVDVDTFTRLAFRRHGSDLGYRAATRANRTCTTDAELTISTQR